MIVPRSSTVVDVPIEEAGHHWVDLVRQRLPDRDFVPDEWRVEDDACGVAGSGDVTFAPVGAARTRAALSEQLDLSPTWTATATSRSCAEADGR